MGGNAAQRGEFKSDSRNRTGHSGKGEIPCPFFLRHSALNVRPEAYVKMADPVQINLSEV